MATQDLASQGDLTDLADRTDLSAEEDKIRLVEETVHVGKERVERGSVRVRTRTETRTETVHVALEDVVVEVERVPHGRFVEAAEAPRTEADAEGEVTILPVYEERAVIETRLWLVEEVRIRRSRRTHEEDVPVELRREVAEVERLDPGTARADPQLNDSRE